MGKQRFNKPFMWLTTIAGALVCLYSAYHLPVARIDLVFLLLAALTLCFGSRLGIEVSRLKVQITVSDTFVFLTLLLYGGEAAILLATAEAFWSSFRFSKLWITRLFNASLLACSTFITAFVVGLLFGQITNLPARGFSGNFITAIGVLACVQYFANSGLAALRESFKFDAPFYQTWKQYYLWTSITYFAGASGAGICANLISAGNLYALIVTVPIIAITYFTYQTYRKHMDTTAAQARQAEEHVAELNKYIAEQERISHALRESEEHFRNAFDHAAIGMSLVSPEGRWLQVNNSLCQIVGFSEEELLTMRFQSLTHPDDLGNNLAEAYKLLEGKIVNSTMEKRYIHKQGHTVWVTLSVSLVRSAQGEPLHFITQVQDITERKLAEEKLHHVAFHDALTGLPNRLLFTEHLQLAVERAAKAENQLFAVLFLDVDRFKNINDSLGHTRGDELLINIARRLEQCVRPQDSVARFGGDEFAVLLNNIKHSNEAMRVVERIQRELMLPLRLGGHEVFTSASIGIALSTISYSKAEDLLRDADTAMYRAKAEGKGRYEVFDKVMHARAMSLLQLENDLRRAIERKEFVVHYQPIINLADDTLSGFEALVRWQHPERGMVSPAEFIPLAEETDLIVPLGQWVLRESCRQVAEWQKKSRQARALSISVNLSGKQLKQPDLVDQIQRVLHETGLDPRCLRLEITESVVMENAEMAATMLMQLRSLNVNLSIDDFGTGYSSLSYLHRFPVNVLKIDRSFVGGMDDTAENGEIVGTILTLAHNLGMEVVAEGVETEEQLMKLKALQCEYGQGFFFARALEAMAAEELISSDLQSRGGLTAIDTPADEIELVSVM